MHEGSSFRPAAATRSISASQATFSNVCSAQMEEHNGLTAKYNCDRLVWFERHQDVARATNREKELKGWRRAKKIA